MNAKHLKYAFQMKASLQRDTVTFATVNMTTLNYMAVSAQVFYILHGFYSLRSPNNPVQSNLIKMLTD